MANFGFYVIPVTVGIIICFAVFKKMSVFDLFTQGAKEGFSSTLAIAPSLIGLIVAVAMLKASGTFDVLTKLILPLAKFSGFPPEVAPLVILRPISGSGTLAILDDIFKNFNPDSFVGKLASIIMGSTETTFYTLTVYFGSVGIKNIRHTLVCALAADVAAVMFALLVVKFA